MSKKKRIIPILILTLAFSSLDLVPVRAEAIKPVDTSSDNPIMQPRVDSLVYYYQTIDGVLYKRLWNATKAEWVDPYWIPA